MVDLIILLIKIIGPIFFVALLVVMVYALRKCNLLKFIFFEDMVEFLSFKTYAAKETEKKWQSLAKRLEKPSEAERKLVIIESESVLEQTLVRMGFHGVEPQGEDFGDKLKLVSKDQLPSIDEVWKAHEIRNNIVHDPDFHLDLAQAKTVFAIYDTALKELQTF